jgi:endoglucanase
MPKEARGLQSEQRAPAQPPTAITNKKINKKGASPPSSSLKKKRRIGAYAQTPAFLYSRLCRKEYIMNTKKFFGYGTRSLLRAIILMVGVMLVFSFTACDNGNNDDVDPNTPATPQPFNDITAAQLVANIKIGWNLGNSLDALGEFSANSTVTQMETGWGNPVTTKAMITAIKNAGFNTIRIPVSWTKAAGGAPNYTIRSDWMARVVQVVNYAVENDMYIILNTHHDEEVFKFMNSNAAAGKAAFQKIWEQIADTFKNYDEKLIFEALNEPRTKGSANEWSGGTPEERNNLNAYYPIFVNAVRNSGGNNDKRILMINTYAAVHAQAAIDGLILPTDTVSNKLVVSIHSYSFPSEKTTWSSSNPLDVAAVTVPIDRVYNRFAGKGIPVIIGEFSARVENNEDAIAAWAEYYVDYAWKIGIKCIWWDDGLDGCLFNRFDRTFYFPKIKDGLMKGTTGTPPPVIPPGRRNIIISPNVYGNAQHGWQAKIPLSELLGSNIQVASGNTFTLTYTFTSNVAIGDLRVVLADMTSPPSYWRVLSNHESIGAVTVGTPVTDTKTITATATAGDSSNEANQFVLETGNAANAPTLTFTTLTLVKN